MRKTLLLTTCMVAFTAIPCLALPVLQLDSPDGVWVGGVEESTVIGTGQFTLEALLDENKLSESLSEYTFYFSIALTPQVDSVVDIGVNYIDGNLFGIDDMEYGRPPVDSINPDSISPHGIYDTFYMEYGFTFDGSTVGAYNVEPDGLTYQGFLLYEAFDIDVSGIRSAGYEAHFDLYGYTGSTSVDGVTNYENIIFAPFSHDATTAPVPEPATMLLFGIGLVGLAGSRLRKTKQ